MSSNNILKTTESGLALLGMGQVAHVIVVRTEVGVQVILVEGAASVVCFDVRLGWLIELISWVVLQHAPGELSDRVLQFGATTINRAPISIRHLLFHPALLRLSLSHLQYAWSFSGIYQRQLVVAVDGINLNYFLDVA